MVSGKEDTYYFVCCNNLYRNSTRQLSRVKLLKFYSNLIHLYASEYNFVCFCTTALCLLKANPNPSFLVNLVAKKYLSVPI